MNEKVTFYVPQTDGTTEVLEKVCRRLSDLYGGATVKPGNEGYWMDDDGELVKDDVITVETISDDLRDDELRTIAAYVKERLNEDVVLFERTETNAAFI